MFKSTRTNITAIFTLIPLIVVLRLCDYMFPWTGLAAIIAVPLIYIIAISIILLAMRVTRTMKLIYFILTWTTITVINMLIAINMYPQEYRPSVTDQIKYTYQVVINSENITEDDLKLYELDNFTRYNCRVRDSRERYVAALYKFQNKVPRNSSHFLYGRTDNPVMENTDIKSKLKTGQDKLIWWLLDRK